MPKKVEIGVRFEKGKVMEEEMKVGDGVGKVTGEGFGAAHFGQCVKSGERKKNRAAEGICGGSREGRKNCFGEREKWG